MGLLYRLLKSCLFILLPLSEVQFHLYEELKMYFVIGTVQLLSLFVILAYTNWKRQTYGTTKQMTFIIQSNFSSSYLGSILDKYFEEGKSLDGKIPLFENYRNMNMTEIYLLWRETFFKDMRNTMFLFFKRGRISSSLN